MRVSGRITINEMAEMLRVSTKTLRRWDKNGKLPASRDPFNNRRYYTFDDLKKYSEENKRAPEVPERIGIYVRVPSFDQDALDIQEEEVLKHIRKHNIFLDRSNIDIYTDYGSEYDFSRPGFNKLMYDAMKRNLDKIVVLDESILCGVFTDWFQTFLWASFNVNLIICEEKDYNSEDAMYTFEGIVDLFRRYQSENKYFRSSSRDCVDVLQDAVYRTRKTFHYPLDSGIPKNYKFVPMTPDRFLDIAASRDNLHLNKVNYRQNSVNPDDL